MDILDTMLNHFIYANENFITNSIAVTLDKTMSLYFDTIRCQLIIKNKLTPDG